ncbi:MAG: serine/threonine-protein kinase [Gemmatimonadota bacterium]|nr:serine/threonine-protein kinase [Gemmatimonadota bacterium]
MTAPAPFDPLFLELQEALVGRYSLERELGRGGMGIVYLARDVRLDRLVAIKLLPPALTARGTLRDRFLHEARIAARLSHPGIVPIHAVEEAGHLVYFVMAYVDGESLGDRLRRQGALVPADVAPILRDAAWALGYAHGQGVIHRDIKPDNLLLERGGRRTLLADFGIAAPLDDSTASGGQVEGTIAYLSPEQARGERLDGRSDLYALGVVGYLMLAGRLPVPAATLAELTQRHLAGAPAPLSSVAPHVPRALARAVDRCLAPVATARFRTGEELAAALDEMGIGGTDLPAPLRVWIAHSERPRGTILVMSGIWGVPLFMGLVFSLANVAPGLFFALVTLSMIVSVPLLIYGAVRVLQTRRVLAAGYDYPDLIRALEIHTVRRQEELAYEFAGRPTKLGQVLRGLMLAGIVAVVGSVIIAVMAGGASAGGLVPVGFIGLVIALGARWLGQRFPATSDAPSDRVAEWAVKIWKGRLGKWMTRLAGWRLTNRKIPEQVLHRPTEVALGQAAEALFEALPAAERRDLARMPAQIRLLAARAQTMRRKIEELDDLIAQAAPTTLFGEPAAREGDGGAGELQSARNLWAERLHQTVALLEGLRLGLLRLHAGSAAPQTLTEDLQAAQELEDRLGLLLDAKSEVAASLLNRGTA